MPSQHIQIACKGDTGEQIGEEDVDGGSENELVEHCPVGYIAKSEVVQILVEKAEGAETVRKAHV